MDRLDGQRWRGSHAEIDDQIDIEVWALQPGSRTGTETIVEISFKTRKYDEEAISKREKLLALLKGRRWLLKEGRLKTERILE